LVQAILCIFQTFFPANTQSTITFVGWLTGLKPCTLAAGWTLLLGGICSFDNWSNLSGIFWLILLLSWLHSSYVMLQLPQPVVLLGVVNVFPPPF
jgi:hypothetical protein